MIRTPVTLLLLLGAAVFVSACASNRQPILMNAQTSSTTPDEFAILPNKPIEQPKDYAALPEPTPGASNRVDPTPKKDAVAALGGNPNRLNASTVAKADPNVYTYASRYGVAENIRGQLAAEDLEFRRRNNGRVLERAFNVNTYFKAYRKQSLDQHAELRRFRQAGVKTVSAPPETAGN